MINTILYIINHVIYNMFNFMEWPTPLEIRFIKYEKKLKNEQ